MRLNFDEFLDSLRTFHNLLITVSVAILLFVLNGNQESGFQAAEAELKQLDSLLMGMQDRDYRHFADSVVQQSKAARENSARLSSLLQPFEYRSYRVTPILELPVFSWFAHFPHPADDLATIQRFFQTSNGPFYPVLLDSDQFNREITELQHFIQTHYGAEFKRQSRGTIGIGRIELTNRFFIDYGQVFSATRESTRIVWSDKMSPDQPNESAQIRCTLSIRNATGKTWLHVAQFPVRLVSIAGAAPADWMMARTPSLQRGSNNIWTGLAPVWNAVRSINVQQAYAVVDSEKRQAASSLNILGFQVDNNNALLAAAISLTVIIFQFGTIASQGMKIGFACAREITIHPWFPLFSNWWSLPLTIISTVVLPIGVLLLLGSGSHSLLEIGRIPEFFVDLEANPARLSALVCMVFCIANGITILRFRAGFFTALTRTQHRSERFGPD